MICQLIHIYLIVLIYVTKIADKAYTQTLVPDNQTMLTTQVEQSSLMVFGTRDVSSVLDISSLSITSQFVSNASSFVSSADFTSGFLQNTSAFVSSIITTQLDSSLSLSIATPTISQTSALVLETFLPNTSAFGSSIVAAQLDSSSLSLSIATPIISQTSALVLETSQDSSVGKGTSSPFSPDSSGNVSLFSSLSPELSKSIAIESTSLVSFEPYLSTSNVLTTPIWNTQQSGSASLTETSSTISRDEITSRYLSTNLQTIESISSPSPISESTIKATESGSVDNADSITKVETGFSILTSELTLQSSVPKTNLFISSTVLTFGTDKDFTSLDTIFSTYQSTMELPGSIMSSQSYGNSVLNNMTSDSPDRTTDILFSTSMDNGLFTELSSSLSMSATRAVSSNSSTTMDLSSSGLLTSDFIAPSSTLTTSEATSSYFELISSSNEGYITSFASLPSKQMTLSTDTVLSSFSSIYDLPVISTRTSRSSIQDTLLYSSDQVISTFNSEISETKTLDGTQTTFSQLETVRQTTPDFSGVTSAFDRMSTSSTTSYVNQQVQDLRRDIADYEDKVNSYMIAVIVLVLIIVLLLAVIILYIIRRRRYYEKKQLKMRGIDEDLMGEQETKLRHNKTYFKTDQSEQLRISGRISTASLGSGGESEPLHLLESFNRTKNKSLELTEENNDGKLAIDKVKDEEL